MQPIEALIEDPIIKLLLIVILVVGVFDAVRFAAEWIANRLTDEDIDE